MVAVVETWFGHDISDALLDPENRYSLIFIDMIVQMVCGVCVFVLRDILSYRTPHVLFNSVEMVCVTVINLLPKT